MMKMQKTIPLKKLRRTRIQNGYRQKDLARQLQCTPQFYSEIERGINVLSYQNALLIADFLETTTDELFKEPFEHLKELDRQKRWEADHPTKKY